MPTTPQVAGMAFRKDKWFEETGYRPHAGQQLAHYDNTRHRVLSNGRRWGKSMFGGKEIETMAFVRNWRGEPMRGWIIGLSTLMRKRSSASSTTRSRNSASIPSPASS
jgi:hypothetical protein